MVKWNLKYITLMTLIAIVCGAIFWLASILFDFLTILLTTLGLAPAALDIVYGFWIIAGPIGGIIFQRPGAAFLTELLSGIVQLLLGDQWGALNIVSGVIQGSCAELGFAATGYRRYDVSGLLYGAIITIAVTFGIDWFKYGYGHFQPWLVLVLFAIRCTSITCCSLLIPLAIQRLLHRSHAI